MGLKPWVKSHESKSTLQHTATYYCTATHYHALQHTATHCISYESSALSHVTAREIAGCGYEFCIVRHWHPCRCHIDGWVIGHEPWVKSHETYRTYSWVSITRRNEVCHVTRLCVTGMPEWCCTYGWVIVMRHGTTQIICVDKLCVSDTRPGISHAFNNCNTMQHTATHCNVLQNTFTHIATHGLKFHTYGWGGYCEQLQLPTHMCGISIDSRRAQWRTLETTNIFFHLLSSFALLQAGGKYHRRFT